MFEDQIRSPSGIYIGTFDILAVSILMTHVMLICIQILKCLFMLMIQLFLIMVKQVQTNLQDDFDTICKWLDLNNMHIHLQKTKVVAIGHRKMMFCQ